MAHAISSFVQRRRWAADAVFRINLRMHWQLAYPLNLPPPTQAGISQDLIPGGPAWCAAKGACGFRSL